MALPFMLWVALVQALIQTLCWVVMQPTNPVAWLSLTIFWGGSLFNLLNPTFDPLR
jgi:Na+/melibiose symporter-like transporter